MYVSVFPTVDHWRTGKQGLLLGPVALVTLCVTGTAAVTAQALFPAAGARCLSAPPASVAPAPPWARIWAHGERGIAPRLPFAHIVSRDPLVLLPRL